MAKMQLPPKGAHSRVGKVESHQDNAVSQTRAIAKGTGEVEELGRHGMFPGEGTRKPAYFLSSLLEMSTRAGAETQWSGFCIAWQVSFQCRRKEGGRKIEEEGEGGEGGGGRRQTNKGPARSDTSYFD